MKKHSPVTNEKVETREQWLEAATGLIRVKFQSKGYQIPPVRVSVGWPSSGGLGEKKKTIGQCWSSSASSDGIVQVFISPWLDDVEGAQGVLSTLIHELIHAVFGTEEGHGKKFGKLARAVGLEGKLTATHAGTELLEYIKEVAKALGAFPHGKLDPKKSGIKKQGTRMIKCECPVSECGYVLRTSAKWILVGIPHCPVHRTIEMIVELPEPAED